jgi:2-C-methyl-D-erythritol 4-phosphate cytidylyltransferase
MHLLIPAAGSGRRMGAECNKLLLPLLDRPILAWTLQAAASAPAIEWIGLIGQPEDWASFAKILQAYPVSKPVEFVVGGQTRQESVACGLECLRELATAETVLVHDGARCLATPALFDRCASALEFADAIVAAIPVKDTINETIASDSPGHSPLAGCRIARTPDRHRLWAAQTPQGFRTHPLIEAHAKAQAAGWEVTDDASLFERLGLPVELVLGEETNLKITTPLDLAIARHILQNRSPEWAP